MNAAPPDETYSVLVLDMAHSHDPDGERTIPGFASVEAARAYAEARTRASVEELRGDDVSPDELRSLWYLYGEDCVVIGGDYRGGAEIDLYVAVPADPSELDWPALTPWVKRFHTTLLFTDTEGNSVWGGGFFNRYVRPSPAILMRLFGEQAKAAFARKRHDKANIADIHVANLFELRNPPAPPIGLPLSRWRIGVDFVCHDVKFGSWAGGVFEWPEQPSGDPLDTMVNVLMADKLSLRGDGPEMADYSEALKVTVEATNEDPDYPHDPQETPLPSG